MFDLFKNAGNRNLKINNYHKKFRKIKTLLKFSLKFPHYLTFLNSLLYSLLLYYCTLSSKFSLIFHKVGIIKNLLNQTFIQKQIFSYICNITWILSKTVAYMRYFRRTYFIISIPFYR